MTDFYGVGPRNKRLGHKPKHIWYYCQLDKHQDCEGKKSVTKEMRQKCNCSCYKSDRLETIKEVDSAIEIIFITALMEHYRNVRDQQPYSQLINNTTTYIQKPVENEEIVKTVTQILGTGNTD